MMLGAPHQETASGRMASFITDIVAPITCNASGSVTRCGKNLFDYSTANIRSGYIRNDSGNEVSDSGGSYNRSYIPVTPGKAYTLSGYSSSASKRFYWYKADKTWISRTSANSAMGGVTNTAPANAAYMQVQLGKAETAGWANVQIEEGSTVTAFEAYSEQTVTIENIGDLKSAVGINHVWTDANSIEVKYWKR